MAEATVLRSSASPRNASPTSASPSAKVSGPLPLVNVIMGAGGKSMQANNGAPKNVTLGPVKGGVTRDGKVIPPGYAPQLGGPQAQAPQRAIAAPALPSLMPEQLMLCRHLVAEYGKAQTAAANAETDVPPEAATNAQLAEDTLKAIDELLAPPVQMRRQLPTVIADNRPHRAQAGVNRRIAAPAGAPAPVVIQMDGGIPQLGE
jgi:hypothetical protein